MSEPLEPQTATGGCLCGAVRFALHGRLPPVGMCHCSLCRRVSGTGSTVVLNVRPERFRWLAGEDPVAAEATSWVRDRKRFKEVEEGIAFRLDFASGLILQGTAAYSSVFSSFVHVHGEKGCDRRL